MRYPSLKTALKMVSVLSTSRQISMAVYKHTAAGPPGPGGHNNFPSSTLAGILISMLKILHKKKIYISWAGVHGILTSPLSQG